MTADVYKHIL